MIAIELRHAMTDVDIANCFPVLKQLRPHLADEAELLARVRRQEAEGYRLLMASHGDDVVGAAGYRMGENLIRGRFVYVDDLAVLERKRRSGIGMRLLDQIERLAKETGCRWITLNTGLDNALAQRFYFRWGMLSTALHFGKRLV
jgi:GNAT superfamily N-acetyltransferase